MTLISELTAFKPGEKAKAAEVNQNFETLRLSNNDQENKITNLQSEIQTKMDAGGGTLGGALKLNNFAELSSVNGVLTLTNETNYFKVSGNETITQITGWTSGIAIVEFLESRTIRNSETLALQNNADRLVLKGDVSLYVFEENKVKEIGYFGAKEVRTNSFKPQTILNCPKNTSGRADFLRKIELSANIVPAMTSAVHEQCVITASSYYDASYLPWKCYRGYNTDVYGWITTNGIATGWTKIEFKTSTPKIVAFSIAARNSADANLYSPYNFILEGSNDDVNWQLLGDYTGIGAWGQGEKRIFALNYSANFKFYRLSVTAISGAGSYLSIGALEYYTATNDYMPMVAKLDLSADNPLLLNNAKGMSASGKVNELVAITESYMLENLLNNSMMYLAMEKQSNNKFQPIITTARPVYTNKLQKHSDINSVPTMISDITTAEFRKGYISTASSTYNASYIPACAFNHNLATKWMASVVGGNQWLQIDFPNPRIAARFGITASADTPTGCISNGYIKGFDGEKWIVLLEIPAQAAWGANEVRYFDATNFTPCAKYKLEIVNIMNGSTYAQIAQFEVFELAYCYVIPENTFYKYNPATGKYEAKEVNFIGRIKTQHNFVSDVNSYAQEGVYISDETNIWASSTFAFSHNLGFDYKNMRISTWIKDKTNGFIMPWEIDSILDYSHEWNNNGFYYDDCLFYVRTGTGLMQYKDYGGTNRSITSNCSLIIQLERNF